ncbi:hypothetical protein ACGFIU_19400 [Rhodococcus oryzae]|uniref:hypothetical protein n=1 Tax=Rhodococcus oryzae TaxID=2571143 RepID=UPI0037223496
MVSKFERRKDTVQELTESGATHVGKIAMIIAGAVRDVTREIGDWITDGIEMREASKRAQADAADEEPDIVEGETDGGESPADK